jgi:HEXXH motif-containing protein
VVLDPRACLLPVAGDATLAELRKKLRLRVLETLLTLPAEGALARVQRWLVATARSEHKGALLAALGGVDVAAPVQAIASGAVSRERGLAVAVPALLAAFARRARGASETVLWDVPVEAIFDPGALSVARFDPPARGVALHGAMLEVRTAAGELVAPEGARAFHPLSGGILLAQQDSNPLAMLEDHPDKGGNAVDLGGHDVAAWLAALREALALVAAALPELHAEIHACLERVVPVGYHAERHLSASYREAPGLVYLSLHPSALTLAEAIIHETQHGKLNLLRAVDPLLENADSAWTSSPIRPDMRPLVGVLLAVHAFVPVAALHAGLARVGHPIASDPTFAARRAEVLASNAEGLATLDALGKPTAIGRDLLEALHVTF